MRFKGRQKNLKTSPCRKFGANTKKLEVLNLLPTDTICTLMPPKVLAVNLKFSEYMSIIL